MNLDQFKPLLDEGESQNLDWKKDWPPALLLGRRDPVWDRGRGELLKDLISIANSSGPSPAHLVYGVKDLRAKREVFGISKSFDDADFQQWTTNTFDPPPTFLYIEIAWSSDVNIGVFSVERTSDFPHVVKENVGEVLYKGQVWFRRGTKNNIATLMKCSIRSLPGSLKLCISSRPKSQSSSSWRQTETKGPFKGFIPWPARC